jgi:GT2 family glycosyltransferase
VNRGGGSLPSVSAIVVSYYTGPALQDCLAALVSDPQITEIVVVNNGNKPRCLGFLNRFSDTHGGRVKLVSGHGNIGFSKGCNLGVSHASWNRFLFINPDAILRRGSVAAFEDAVPQADGPWIIGGRIFDENGAEQRGGRRRTLRFTSAIMTFTGLSPFEKLHPIFQGMNKSHEASPAGPVPMPVVSGALMYMSRAGFEQVGGFDEDYFLHVEDIDICRRVQEAEGGAVYYTPFAAALHHGGTSDASSLRVEWEKAWGLGLYFRKHSSGLSDKILAYCLVPVFAILLWTRCFSKRFLSSASKKLKQEMVYRLKRRSA